MGTPAELVIIPDPRLDIERVREDVIPHHRWYGTADLAEPRSFLIALNDRLPVLPPNLRRLKADLFDLPTLVELVGLFETLRHLHLEELDVTLDEESDPSVSIRLPLLEVLVIERIVETEKSPDNPNDPPAITVTFVVNRLATVCFGKFRRQTNHLEPF